MAHKRSEKKRSPLQFQESKLSTVDWIIYFIIFFYLGLVIYSFTPYTHNLDEIKVSILYVLGPILLCLYLFFCAQGYLRIFRSRVLVFLLGYFAVMLVSTLVAGKHYSWVGWLQLGFHISLLGAFFFGFGLIRSKEDIHRVLFLWMIFGLGTAVFGLFHYAGGFKIFIKIFVTEENRYRPMSILFQTFVSAQDDMFSTILNRQFYAAFLVMLLPLSAAYAIVEERSHLWRYIGIAATILMGICLYLAHSKASSGATVVTAFAFLVLYKLFARYKKIRIPHLGIWIAGFLMIALTLGVFTADVGPEKFKTVKRSVESRVIIWGGGWDMFLYGPGSDNWYELESAPPLSPRSLLLGCGPGSFRLVFPRYRSPDYHLHDISNVTLYSHNRYLDLLSETGLLGFVCYMGFILLFFTKGMKGLFKSEHGELRVYNIAFMCSIFGILLSNIFSPNCRWTVVATNMWAILGFGFGVFLYEETSLIKSKEPQKKSRQLPKARIIPSPGLANSLLILMALLLPVVFLCARFGVKRFQGAKFNNTGLTYSKVGEAYQEEGARLSAASPNQEQQEMIEKLAYMSQRYYHAAIDSFNKALAKNRFFITTYYKLAHAYNAVDDVENSLNTYLELRKYAPDYSEIHFNLGVVYAVLSRQKRVKAMKNKKVNQPLLKEAKEFDDTSLKEFRIAAKMSNKHQVQGMYGKKLLLAAKYKEAKKVFEFLLSLSPDELEYIRTLAMICDRTRDEEAALKYYTRLFHIDPTNDAYFNRLEGAYRKSGDEEKFESFLKEAVGANPLDPLPRLRLLQLYIKNNDAENIKKQLTVFTALPNLDKRLSRDPVQRQSQLYELSQAARGVNLEKEERFFLKKCLALDSGTSIGKSCQTRLREISN